MWIIQLQEIWRTELLYVSSSYYMLNLYANEFATNCILLLYLQSQWIFHQSEVSVQVVEMHCLPVERSLSCMIEHEESISKKAMDCKERLETNDWHSAEARSMFWDIKDNIQEGQSYMVTCFLMDNCLSFSEERYVFKGQPELILPLVINLWNMRLYFLSPLNFIPHI